MPTTTLERPAVELAPARLTRADRCDSCNAQAFIEARNDVGLVLLFCGHHGREHEAGLIAGGFSIHDETHRINTAASTSSA